MLTAAKFDGFVVVICFGSVPRNKTKGIINSFVQAWGLLWVGDNAERDGVQMGSAGALSLSLSVSKRGGPPQNGKRWACMDGSA